MCISHAKFKHYYIPLKVKTNDTNLQPENQAVKSLTVYAYTSKPNSKNYLHISLPTEELKIGNTLFLTMNIPAEVTHKNQDITYMVRILTISINKCTHTFDLNTEPHCFLSPDFFVSYFYYFCFRS